MSFEAGVTAVDTAPVYGFGHSERLVARARRRLGRAGDGLSVMTKVGLSWEDHRGKFGFETRGIDGKKRRVYRNGRADSIVREIDQCLARLECDALDLVQVHASDPTTPISETLGALKEAHHQGKVRAIGVSNYSPQEVAEAKGALGDVPLASVQSLYSALSRDIENDLVPYARENGVAVIAYSPLDQGLLTGNVRADRAFGRGDARARRSSFTRENRARVNAVLDRVVAPIAAAHGATIAQTMLAWTISQPGITVALAGARSPAQAIENAAAMDIVLSKDEGRAIRAGFEQLVLEPRAVTFGDRVRGGLHRLRFGR